MSNFNDLRPKMKNQNFLILRQSENFDNSKKASKLQSNQNTSSVLGGQEMLIKQALDYKKLISLSLNRENQRFAYKGRCKKLQLIEQEQEILRILKQDNNKMQDLDMSSPLLDDIEKLESPIQQRRQLAVNQINNGNYFLSAPNSGQKKSSIQNKNNLKRYYLNTESGIESSSNTYNLNTSMQEPIITLQQETPLQQNKLDVSFPKIKSPSNQSNIQRIRATNNNSQFPQNENILKLRDSLNKPLRINKNESNKQKEDFQGNEYGRNFQVSSSQSKRGSNSLNKANQKVKNDGEQNKYFVHKYPNLAAQSNILKSRNNSPKDVENIKTIDITIPNQNQQEEQQKQDNDSYQKYKETNKENNNASPTIKQNDIQENQQQNILDEKKIVDMYLEEQQIELSQPKNLENNKSKQNCLSNPTIGNKDEDLIRVYEKQSNNNFFRSSQDNRNSSCDQFYGKPSDRDNYTSYRQILKEQKNMQIIHHLEKEETRNLMKVEETRKRVFQILQDKVNQQQNQQQLINSRVDQSFILKGNEKWNFNVQVIEKKNRSKSVAETRNIGLEIKRQQKISEERKKEKATLLKLQQKQLIEEQQKKEQQEQLLKEQKCQKIKVSLQKSREQICKALQEKKFQVQNQINKSILMERQKNDILSLNIQQLEEIEQNLLQKLQETQIKQQGVLIELQDALELNPEQFCQEHFSQIKQDQERMLTEQSMKIFNLINRRGNLY